MPDFERVTITIEPDLLRRTHEAIQSRGHGSRPEAIRDLIRPDLVPSVGVDAVVTTSLAMVLVPGRRALSDRPVAHDATGVRGIAAILTAPPVVAADAPA